MKIYSYLASGVPMVATRIESHTQVLDQEVAVLTEARATAYADGIGRLLSDPAGAREMGHRAQNLAQRCYSREAYRRKVAALYAAVERRVRRAG